MSQTKITRDDLERRFAEMQGGLESRVEDRRRTIITAAGAATIVMLLLFFLLGRRSGRKRTTIVEIRRV